MSALLCIGGLIAGLFIGALVGISVASLCDAAAGMDDRLEREQGKRYTG